MRATDVVAFSFSKGYEMREETKRSLEELLSKAETGDDTNLKEAARVVRRDLLKGGRHAVSPPVLFAAEQEPVTVEGSEVVWKPKPKKK